MWESSKYFEDFEIAANYVNGRFDPKQAQAVRVNQRKQAEQLAAANSEVRTTAQRHRPHSKSK